jgi:L-ascorbate metabolism protein UlaG (beta-lactamase superfamily)
MQAHWLLIIALSLLLVGCSSYYQGPESDHFDGHRFYNPGAPMEKSFSDFLRWRFTREPGAWPDYFPLKKCDRPPARITGDALRVSYVGHATVLLQSSGLNILTDPVYSKRTSPVRWAGPERVHPPGIMFDHLPKIDIVLISHSHYDHLDLATITRLWQRDHPRIIVPLGNDTIISSHDRDIQAEAYDWGQLVQVSNGVTIHLEPMYHWSARGMFDRNRSLWAAFVISSAGGNIYFVGDSGFGSGENFKRAREKYTNFRLAILPIGSYDPRWFMRYGHMNPAESLQALQLLGSPAMLPIHYNTFQLADTGFDVPLHDLQEAMAAKEIPTERIITLQPGWYRLLSTD